MTCFKPGYAMKINIDIVKYHLLLSVLCSMLVMPAVICHAGDFHDLQAVGMQGPGTSVVIRGRIVTEDNRQNSLFFSTDDVITLEFIFDGNHIRPDVKGQWFIAAHTGGAWFLKDALGVWHAWDGQVDHMIPALECRTEMPVNISFSMGPGLPQGEYALYAGFRTDTGTVMYGRKSLPFVICSTLESAGMHRIEHVELLENFLKGGVKAWDSSDMSIYDMMDTYVPPPGAATSSTGTEPLFSSTNLQEQGVDEADLIKTDGVTLYRTDWCGPKQEEVCLSAHRLIETPPSSFFISSLALHKKQEPGEIYLLHNRPDGRHDTVIHISGQGNGCYSMWDNPWWWQSGSVEITMIDVADPGHMAVSRNLKLDGVLIASRLIKETLYVVTRSTPRLSESDSQDPDAAYMNNQLEQADISDLLPAILIDGNSRRPLVQPENCFIPVMPPEIVPGPSIITITAIPVDEPANFTSVAVAGKTDTIYVSSGSIYLVSCDQNTLRPVPIALDQGDLSPVPSAMSADPVDIPRKPFTDLYKFVIDGTGIKYAGRGRVPGTLGTESGKRPFRMDEYQGIMRIVTSAGNSWDNTSSTNVYLLKEDTENHALLITGRIENLGRPGERLYASRFTGNRGFLVTFKVTDPLYILDLKDPEHPELAGELHINGYSDYLHPVGDNLLLGIGKDAIPDQTSPDRQGRGAWYQGLKISLYDITAGHKPEEIKSMTIGRRGTRSAVLYDHHAFTWLRQDDAGTARFAIPVELADSLPGYGGFDPSQPYATYDWTSTGLWLFDIVIAPVPDIKQAGTIITNVNSHDNPGTYPARLTMGDRAVIQDNTVHYIHGSRIYSRKFGAGTP